MSEDYIDYRLLRDDLAEKSEHIIVDGSLGEQVEAILRSVAILPYDSIQMPIITSFITSPVTLMSSAGILFLWGSSGTGKSQISTVAAELWSTTPMNANSTFASIRNKIQSERFWDIECKFEKNFILVWEDITPNLLIEDERMLSLFKILNRKNSLISISSQTPGVNMVFNGFALKVINSIHPLWTFWELNELKRRMFPIHFKSRNAMTASEYHGDIDVSDLLDIEDMNINKYSSQVSNFWRDIGNCTRFNECKKALQKQKKDIKNPKLSLDVIATHSVIYESDINNSINVFNTYWDFVDKYIFSVSSGTEQFLDSFIENSIMTKTKQNEQAINAGCFELVEDVYEIDPKILKQAIEKAKSDGYLDTRLTTVELTNLMKNRGFCMVNKPGKINVNVWKKII